ncbi:MAG: glycosyltransferase family 9 protein [Sedimenticola sp.]
MKILAIRYSGLGDLVMLLPALQRLKVAADDVHITLATDCFHQDFKLLSCGLIDEVICLDRRRMKRGGIWTALVEIYNFYRQLRSSAYDQVIDFQNFGETATISYLARAKVKRGAPKKSKYHYGYSEIVERVETDHRSQFFCRIAGVDDHIDYPRLCLDDAGVEYAAKLGQKIDSARAVIGLNIGSTQESRRWDHHNFAKLARHLSTEHQILVFAGPSELQYIDVFGDESFVVQGATIPQLCGAISLCSYFVSNDTGPVHLAAALGVPTLTLFSTGDDWCVGALIEQRAHLRNEEINKISVEDVLIGLSKLAG